MNGEGGPQPLVLRLRITVAAPLSPGGGGGLAWGPYRPVFRRGGRLVLAASSLKGRMRWAVEALVEGLDLPPCEPLTCRTDPCAVCRMFGAPWVPGRLRFSDVSLDAEGPAPLESRSHVSLMRQTGSAYPGRLWLEERVGAPGGEYEACITGFAKRDDLGLLLCALRTVDTIGASASRGSGWVAIRPVEVRLGPDAVNPDALVKEFLKPRHGGGCARDPSSAEDNLGGASGSRR